jgi:hypothetical protein
MKHIKIFEDFLNETMSKEDYDKINDVFEAHKKEIEDALYKGSDHRDWKLIVLPKYDNVIGGYNIQATAVTGFFNEKDFFIEKSSLKAAISSVKKLPFVSKAMPSRAYNQKMITVIAIGLKIKK